MARDEDEADRANDEEGGDIIVAIDDRWLAPHHCSSVTLI